MKTPDDGEPTRADLQDEISQLHVQHAIDREVVAHLEAEGLIDREKIANLEAALITCRRIGAAIGILMARHQATDEQAFDLLRSASQDSHRKLRDVADEVMLTGTLDVPPPPRSHEPRAD